HPPEDRPTLGVDGDPLTAWRVDAFDDPIGERLRIEPRRPVTTDHVTLVQPLNGPRNRFITRVTLSFDRGKPVTRTLDDSSRTTGGQRVTFPRRPVRRLEVRLDDTN